MHVSTVEYKLFKTKKYQSTTRASLNCVAYNVFLCVILLCYISGDKIRVIHTFYFGQQRTVELWMKYHVITVTSVHNPDSNFLGYFRRKY